MSITHPPPLTRKQDKQGPNVTMNPFDRLGDHFTVRPPTLEDIPALLPMINRASIVMQGHTDHTAQQVETEMTWPGHSLEADERIVLDGDRIVGIIALFHHENPPVSVWTWGRVDPDYEGRGIGTALMAWVEQRARQAALPRVPSDIRVVMHAGASNGYAPAEALFQACGMTCARHFWQMRILFNGSIQPSELPEGIALRTFEPPHDLEPLVHAVRDAFRDHWGHSDTRFEEELADWQHWIETDPDYDPTKWWLAMDGEEIAGMALTKSKSGTDERIAYVDTLGVRRPWRRRGLGVALLRHAFAAWQGAGKDGVDLHVDASNPSGATRLYEQAGMVVHQQNANFEKELRAGRDVTYRESFDGEPLLTPHEL